MGKRKPKKKPSFEIVKMSELPQERQEVTKVVVMDKQIHRKIKPGEEQKLEEIAKEEGVLDFVDTAEGVPEAITMMWGDKPTISGTDLQRVITRDFGPACRGGRVFVSKNSYFLYTDEEIERVLSADHTDLHMWINAYFHSPDFSIVLAGAMKDKLKGVPFGMLWIRGRYTLHACNCYYSSDQTKMKVVEPQTDVVYDLDKVKYCPMLVVI